jgi:aspartyl-tRNA(Asn)/glutamyl-tRNA(Gln) amidotransferase subunit A
MTTVSRRAFVQGSAAGLLTATVPTMSFSDSRSAGGSRVNIDLNFMSATMLIEAIRTKKISPVEAVDAVYKRIHEVNPRINAYCTLTEELARAAAKEAEAAVMRGDQLGLLHGVPVSVKDVILTRGVRTMYGSRIRENYVPDENAPAVDRMLAAGAILVGKTTTSEFAFKAVTDSPLTGVTRNPWDTSKTPGGSSGGAAAAVASGLAPLALGTDGAGSVRIPAAFTGIFGFKPSLGRIAYFPSSPVPFLVHAGPLTRTVGDAALLLNVIAGPDERDLLSLPADATDYLAQIRNRMRRLRVAWSPDLGYVKVNAEVSALAAEATREFERSLGSSVEIAHPMAADSGEILSVLWTMSYALRLRGFLAEWENRMDPELVKLVREADTLSPTDYGEAVASRGAFWDKVRTFFDRYDLLITPSAPILPFPVGENAPEQAATNEGKGLSFLRWLVFTYPWNITGQPAASIPCGFTRGGLPVSIQIIGRRFADATVLQAAAAFEQVRPWVSRRPPV